MSDDGVIWAMGGRNSTNLAHAYVSQSDYENGVCLCGRSVKPHVKFDNWDLSEEEATKHTCPQCMERIRLLRFR